MEVLYSPLFGTPIGGFFRNLSESLAPRSGRQRRTIQFGLLVTVITNRTTHRSQPDHSMGAASRAKSIFCCNSRLRKIRKRIAPLYQQRILASASVAEKWPYTGQSSESK